MGDTSSKGLGWIKQASQKGPPGTVYLPNDNGQNLLWAPEGQTLIQDVDTNTSTNASFEKPVTGGASTKSTHHDDRKGMGGSSPSAVAPLAQRAVRQPTPEELLAKANDMLDSQSAQHKAQLDNGPATGVRDDAGGKIPDWLVREMEKDKTQSF